MEARFKQIIKKFVPQTAINIARGAIQRTTSRFAPVIQCNIREPIICLTDDKVDYVGGYYDITPFSPQGDKYLLLRLVNESNADIELYDLKSNIRKVVNNTKAVNRQQGSRLRWDLRETGRFYYNDFVDGQYVCAVSSIDSEAKAIIGPAFYDMSPVAGFGLSLNFSRLGKMRAGYGY